MKAQEIRNLNTEEIRERVREEKEQLDHLRFEHAVRGMLENPLLLRRKRRLVARLKTILNEKERQAEAA